MRRRRAASLAGTLSFAIVCPLAHAYDQHFDYTSFDTNFGQSQFNVLNYPSVNGNYMMTSGDGHRPEMVANNNNLAEFYNWLEQRYEAHTTKDGNLSADEIDAYVVSNSTSNGPKPNWLILNEISASLWPPNAGPPSNSTYRQWLVDCVTRLHDHYGYNVVTYSPFQNPGANDESWQALSAKSYIGIECYLSGTEVWNSGSTDAQRLSWAQSQYQASKNSYLARGVAGPQIFVSEHFANNNAVTDTGDPVGWGRAGLASAADWDTVIQLRQDAIKAVGFAGFLAYSWGGNGMNVTLAEQIEHEYYYRSRLVMASQQPQWLSDSAINVNGMTIPLSWNEPLNWIGGVPNASGAVANFFRTNSTSRTITLDGSKTVGTLSFNSPYTYTISAGSGGTLTLNNGAAAANVSVTQGTHVISTQLSLSSNATLSLTGSLILNGNLSNPSGKTITKSGSGTFTIGGTQSHGAGAVLTTNAGSVFINTDAGSASAANLTLNANSAVTLNATQHLAALNVGSAATVMLSASGSRVINTGSVSITSAKLDLTNNDLIARNGSIGSWNGSTYTGILGLVQSGRGNGTWNGNGIITSRTEARSPSVLTTLAASRAGDALGISSAQTTLWSGETVNGNAVLVMYTYGGDANLDGVVNGDDYFAIDSHVNQSGNAFGYENGDFNYDGQINGNDYFIIDSNITAQGAPMLTSGAAMGAIAVPEPGAVSIVVSALILLRRRRSRV